MPTLELYRNISINWSLRPVFSLYFGAHRGPLVLPALEQARAESPIGREEIPEVFEVSALVPKHQLPRAFAVTAKCQMFVAL